MFVLKSIFFYFLKTFMDLKTSRYSSWCVIGLNTKSIFYSMAYLRVKSIRDQKYLYLVKSDWDSKKKTSKQSIIKYLGIESECISF